MDQTLSQLDFLKVSLSCILEIRYSLLSRILQWKLFFNFKLIKWGRLGTFLEIQKFWPQDQFLAISKCGRFFKWKVFFYIKFIKLIKRGHLGVIFKDSKILTPRPIFFQPFRMWSNFKVKTIFLHKIDWMGSLGVIFINSKFFYLNIWLF